MDPTFSARLTEAVVGSTKDSRPPTTSYTFVVVRKYGPLSDSPLIQEARRALAKRKRNT